MTFAPVGSPIHHYGASFTSFSLTPGGVGDLILLEVENLTDHTVYCTGLSSSNVTWTQMGTSFLGSVNTSTAVLFAGRVTSTSTATVTVSWSGATPTTAEVAGQEFSTTHGAWALDVQGHIDSSGTNNWASLTPSYGSGELYFGFSSDPGTASGAGTSGYTYSVSGNGNGMAYNANCGTGATFPVWTDGQQHLGIMVLVREVSPYYTENLCPNPSFENSLAGYTALTGTTLSQDTTQGKAGRASMQVVTDGSVPGEGFTAPSVTVPSAEGDIGSISFYLMGETGTLTISAVAGSTATVVGQTTVTLSGNDYTRVVLSGLALTPGQPMYFLIQTPTAQALTFWVDAVQYEMNSSPHPYIDGSFLHCVWEGTAGLSASYQQYQFPTSAIGGMHLEGHATPVAQGEIFKTSAKGSMLLSGTESGTLDVNPVAALSAFGMWTTADMDPAVSYAPWSNAGLTTSSSWQRVLGLFQPPQQYVASNGQVLWNRAAYAAVGFWFKSIANTAQEMLTDVQWERMPVVPGTNPAPTTWQTPRQVNTIVKPTRLNFIPNPSIEISTADWTVIGSAAIAQDATVFVTGTGTHSLKVTVNAANDGAYITIPDLIIGDTYVVSASVQGGPGLQDVIVSCSGAQTSSSEQGIPYGGGTFGGGPYGGIEATGADMPTGQWFLPNMIFTAQQSTVNLAFQSLVGSDVAYPTHFWVDALLLEAGEDLLGYFDGSYGTDYSWESGATAGLTRSYYYERSEVAAGAVTTALAEHTPLGILAASPVYSLPYTQ